MSGAGNVWIFVAGWRAIVVKRGPDWSKAIKITQLTRRGAGPGWVCSVRFTCSGCEWGWAGVAATGISTMVLVEEYP